MIDICIDYICAMIGGRIFHQKSVSIWYHLCISLRRIVSLILWNKLCMVRLYTSIEKMITGPFFTFRYIDDVISLNNSKLSECCLQLQHSKIG